MIGAGIESLPAGGRDSEAVASRRAQDRSDCWNLSLCAPARHFVAGGASTGTGASLGGEDAGIVKWYDHEKDGALASTWRRLQLQ